MKKITPIKSLALLITLFCAVSFGFGQSIFDNPITGTNPNIDSPYTTGQTYDANIVATGIERGIGVQGRDANDRYNARRWAPGFDSNDYFEFTMTPNAGYRIDFVSFNYSSQRSDVSIDNFAFRSSIDGYASDIATPAYIAPPTQTTIDLSTPTFQNITGSITFRFYAWGGGANNNEFSINDFTFNGVVSAVAACSGLTTTWDLPGPAWDNGAPDLTKPAIINAAYNTSSDGSFSACSLTVNPTFRLSVDDGTFVEIENAVTIDGELIVETEGNFVQNDDAGTFTVNAGGLARVNKSTALKADWFYYTYWSSPVTNETIGSVFPDVDGDRRFWFNAANFVDNDGDDIDDDGDDWQYALAGDSMIPGVGYAVTESRLFIPPPFGGASGSATFEGPFNTGDIDVNIDLNVANTGFNWNFIGNPYPSAVDFIAFQAANSSVIDGAAYYWSQSIPPSESNPGNEQSNFSTNDYATFSIVTGPAAGASGIFPTQYIPSGQGIFIPAITSGPATFTNAMRMADATSNSEFFKSSSSKKQSNTNENRLWVNLTSDNGVFNQILVGYVDGATNGNDGLAYDAPRIISPDYAAVLYSSMNDNNKKYVIQGKDINSINEDELINLGFSTTIDVETIYTLSIAQIEGDFLSNNPIYIKDNLLNKLHDISASDYTFTSEVGEFNDRFEIVFNANALSVNDDPENSKFLKIIELEDDSVQFTASHNLRIKSVNIFDLFGRQLYSFKGNNASETYTLSNLSSSIYIAKVALSNGIVVTKKAIKK